MICIFFIYFTQLLWSTNSYSVHVKLPEMDGTVIDPFEHLKYTHIKAICESRDAICKGNDTNVCSMKYVNGSIVYKDFINTCYLFLANMCDIPGDEYYIVNSGSCKECINSRRDERPADTSPREDITMTSNNKVTPILRNKIETTFSTLYDIDTAFDFHVCPHSCPDTYSPVCVSANRGNGKYFKFFTFVNHCSGDLYYCKNWQEFTAPDDGGENVNVSPLGWSFCGASRKFDEALTDKDRNEKYIYGTEVLHELQFLQNCDKNVTSAMYLQFSRFAEVTSSMGHYGWLAGNYPTTHIMEPHQRIPGYG